MPSEMHALRITAPASFYDLITAHLVLNAAFGWEEGECAAGCFWLAQCENRDFLRSLADNVRALVPAAACELNTVENRDWTAAWREFFTPVEAGPFVVLPPWRTASGKLPVVIEPKSAFGTGHHASTVLCLEALGRLLLNGQVMAGQTFLDLGCGTGVLGIACARAGLAGICIDIDPLAVENARENMLLNDVADIEVLAGSLERCGGRVFDLALANILAAPLIEMAAELAARVSGCLVLSGILDRQANAVWQAYLARGMKRLFELQKGEWRALALAKLPA